MTPATPEPTPSTFDVTVCQKLSEACQDVFLHHPEVQAIAVSIAWYGGLNDAAINHGVWIGPNGPVVSPSGILTSVFQTLKMLDQQMGRAMTLAEDLRKKTEELAKEAVAKHEELRKLQAEIEAARRTAGVPG